MTFKPDAARILLVDDDRKFSRLLTRYLGEEGFEVGAAFDGAEALKRVQSEPWDLVVLDVMLPKLDGFVVLARLRVESHVPVLMLTARGAEEDRIAGLDQGADDYLPKTTSARELSSRVRAILRRTRPVSSSVAEPLSAHGLVLDAAAHSARLHGETLALTPVEFGLLQALMRRAGHVCTREQLSHEVLGQDYGAFDRSIDVHMVSLRRKLGDDPRQPHYIATVRALGYRFLPEPVV